MPTVLVVEDDWDLRHLIADILELEGYRVLTAADGQQGLAVCSTQAPDLVISDLMMPVLSGCEMARALRADARYHHLPFLAISGAVQQATMGVPLFTQFLAKPFQVADLVAATAQCLGTTPDLHLAHWWPARGGCPSCYELSGGQQMNHPAPLPLAHLPLTRWSCADTMLAWLRRRRTGQGTV